MPWCQSCCQPARATPSPPAFIGLRQARRSRASEVWPLCLSGTGRQRNATRAPVAPAAALAGFYYGRTQQPARMRLLPNPRQAPLLPPCLSCEITPPRHKLGQPPRLRHSRTPHPLACTSCQQQRSRARPGAHSAAAARAPLRTTGCGTGARRPPSCAARARLRLTSPRPPGRRARAPSRRRAASRRAAASAVAPRASPARAPRPGSPARRRPCRCRPARA